MSGKRLTGRIAADRIGPLGLPAIDAEVVAGFAAIADLTSSVSDILDRLGVFGAVPASTLAPTMPGSRLVGRAITVENVPRLGARDAIVGRAERGENGLADLEAHNLAEPGDVLVIQGFPGISSIGRISARIGKRQGELGAIVDGAVRDLDSTRAMGYPIWSRGTSPITGKYRLETVAINRPVRIAGVVVSPGDLVLADEVGVVFVPFGLIQPVLAGVAAAVAAESKRLSDIDGGVPVADLAGGSRAT